MKEFVLAVKLGVSAGALDALLALGIVLIFRTTGVLNFAQAATGAIAAYTAYAVAQGGPLWLAIIVGLLVGGTAGGATYAVVGGIRSRSYALTTAVATLAIALLLKQIIAIFWNTTAGTFPDPLPFSSGLNLAGVPIESSTIAHLAAAGGLALGVGMILRWTRVGIMLRALADNPDAARLCGGKVWALTAGVWIAAGVLAAVAGMFAAQSGIGPPSFLDTFLIAALSASVLARLRSLTGAFLAALSLEVAWNLILDYGSQYVPFDILAYERTFITLLLIIVLVFVPRRWLASSTQRQV